MATSLQSLREQYPQYDDMSDQDFAKAFHKKFYSDLDFDDFSRRIGLTSTMAPSGTEIVDTFDNGGRIVKNIESGKETFISDSYATSDPQVIAQIRAAKGDAGAVYKRSMAEDIIGQLGQIPSRAASAIKGVPFIGSYIDEAIGAVSPQAAQATRAAQESREIVAPITTGVSRAGVGLATAIPAAMAAPTLAVTPLGTTLGGRVAAGAVGGATLGGIEGLVYGAGEGRTRAERRSSAEQQAKTGAVIGGALGPLGPLVGGAIGGIAGGRVSAPARKLGQELDTKGQALELLSEAARMDAPVAGEAMQRAGQYASLGQMGPATRNLLDLAASSTSEGAAIARQNIDEVAGQAGRQFSDLLDTSFGGPQAAQAIEDALMQSTSGQRRELYEEAYEQAIDYSSPIAKELEDLLEGVDTSIIKNAEMLMRRERQPSSQIMARLDDAGNVIGFETLPDVRQIDYITRALNNVSPTAAPEDKNSARNLASKIRKALDQLVPEYRTARDLAGDVISIRDALDLGTGAFKSGTTRYDLSKALETMSASEKTALKQGVRSYIDEIMANAKVSLTDPDQDAREVIKPLKDMTSRAGREKLGIILGDEAKEFIRQLDEIYSVMSMRAGVAQQSKTAIRDMAKEAAKDRMDDTMGKLMGERGPVTGALEALRRQAFEAPSDQRRFEMLMGEIAQPLVRQADLTDLMRQMQGLQKAAPQLQRGRDIYEAGKRMGTYGAIGLTPAMQTLLGPR